VLSVTQIHGGDAYNVIPDRIVVRGTGRWFSEEAGDRLETRLKRIAGDVAGAYDCLCEVRYQRRYPATINDPTAALHAREAAGHAGLLVEQALPSMASEDFAFMLNAAPGAYGWLGSAQKGDNPGLHSPFFDFNDDAIAHGIAYWTGLIERRLG